MDIPKAQLCPHSASKEQPEEAFSSQDIIDNPDHIPGIIAEYEGSLRTEYQRMAHYRPAQAEVTIARKVRALARGALGAITTQRMAEILSGSDRGDMIQHLVSQPYTYQPSQRMNLVRYHGMANAMMGCMSLIHDETPVLDRDSPDSYVLKKIEESSPRIYTALANAYAALKQGTGEFWQDWSYAKELGYTSRENISLAIAILIAANIAIVKSGEVDPRDKDTIAEQLNKNLEPLTRLSSVNKATLLKVLFGGKYPENLFSAGGADLTPLEGTFIFRGGLLTPTHKSIANGPWRVSANCTGNKLLRVSDPITAQGAHEFSKDMGSEGNSGEKARTTELLMQIAIEIARHTILPAEYSPVVQRHCPSQSHSVGSIVAI